MVGMSLLGRVVGILYLTAGMRKVMAMALLRSVMAGRSRSVMSLAVLPRFFVTGRGLLGKEMALAQVHLAAGRRSSGFLPGNGMSGVIGIVAQLLREFWVTVFNGQWYVQATQWNAHALDLSLGVKLY